MPILEAKETYQGFSYYVVKHDYGMPYMENNGYRCGYVLVPEDHPFYNKTYQDIEKEYELDVHAGLTFSGKKLSKFQELDRWYIGFDCAHCNDTLENCDVDYVAEECKSLIDQMLNLKGN